MVNTPCMVDGDCVYPDACYPGARNAGTCHATPVACDDGVTCTADVWSEGMCAHMSGFTDVESLIDGPLAVLNTPPCSPDGIKAAVRKKAKKKLATARRKVAERSRPLAAVLRHRHRHADLHLLLGSEFACP